MIAVDEGVARAYLQAKWVVIEEGYWSEIDWQRARSIEDLTESAMLSEMGWVVLSSGMREAVVRDRFALVSRAFDGWTSAQAIARQRDACIRAGIAVFGHVGKITAIAHNCQLIAEMGWPALMHQLRTRGVDALIRLKYIGPVTKYHLAKNIGLEVAKPDRHLVRIAGALGARSVDHLCTPLAEFSGDPVSVVDLVLWRFATLRTDYVELMRHWRSMSFDVD